MRVALFRRVLLIIVAVLLFVSHAPATRAQDGTPVVPSPTPQSTATEGRVVDPETLKALEAAEANAPQPTVTADAVTEESSTAVPTAEEPVVPTEVVPAPSESTEAVLQPRATQGAIKLDMATSASVTAASYIKYTYVYTNTTGAAENNIIVEAWWGDFGTTTSARQYCLNEANGNCDVLPGSVSGPTVTKLTPCPVVTTGHYCFQIGSLGANQSGSFSIQLHTNSGIFPQTNKAITSLAGSSKLYRSSAPSTLISDDTASALVVGPVLTVTKTPVTQGSIYTGDNGTFAISVGNATGTADKSGTNVRADARPATNIVVTDVLPDASEFVSATNGGTYDATTKEVTWKLNSTLAPGQKLPDFQVVFKKVSGVTAACATLNNKTLRLSSDEYPLDKNSKHVAVTFGGAAIKVVVPLQVTKITSTPGTVYFGDQGSIEIEVSNYWDKPINNAVLTYNVQSNAKYVGASASPAATSTTDAQVKWTFSMPAGNKTTPTTKKFYLNILAGFVKNVQAGTGNATLTMPNDVPGDCFSKDGRPTIAERLTFRKLSEEENNDVPMSGSTYLVSYGYEFEYIIRLANRGTTPIDGVTVTDMFPTQVGANFALVPGSMSTPGTDIGGGIMWENISIPPEDSLDIRYKLYVRGLDYVLYCNTVTVDPSGDEPAASLGNKVCVKINPDIVLTKTVDKPTVDINPDGNTPEDVRTVTFTMSITNKESKAYTINIYDKLATEYEYVGPVSVASQIDPGTPDWDSVKRAVVWPLKSLAPNQSMTVAFKARVPDLCVSKSYKNSALFHNDQGNIIQPVPEVAASVQVNCGKIEYSIAGDRSPISLKDALIYTISLKNADSSKSPTFNLETRLPPRFSFVAMDATSAYKTAPTVVVSGSFTTLKWTNVDAIAANTTIKVKFRAVSGETILSGQNNDEGAWVRVTDKGKCVGTCIADPDSGALYSVAKTKVDALAILDPKVVETGCAQIGGTRTYKVSVVNRNNHVYNSTSITVSLPLGLEFSKTLNSTSTPAVFKIGNGQTLVWKDQIIPAPSGSTFAQKDYEIELKVGNAIGALRAIAQASSPDGLIPRKEGTVDPTVFVCLPEPAIALVADPVLVKPGDLVSYQVMLANPKTTAFTINMEQSLPDGLTYDSFVSGTEGTEPTLSSGKLTWTGITVPAADGDQFGQVLITFLVRVDSDATIGQAFTSKVTLLSQTPVTPVFDVTRTTATIHVARDFYLPLSYR